MINIHSENNNVYGGGDNTNNAINTMVVECYLPHIVKAIEKLDDNNLIKIKYWMTAEDYTGGIKKYPSLEDMQAELLQNEAYMDKDVQTKLREKYLYKFINIENRWVRSIEINNYVNRFYLYARYFYTIIKNNDIKLFIMGQAPHVGYQLAAYAVAKSMNIDVLLMEQMHFGTNRFMCVSDIDNFGLDELGHEEQDTPYQKLDFKFEKDLYYMKDLEPVCCSGDSKIYGILQNIKKKGFKLNKENIAKGINSIGLLIIKKSLQSLYKINSLNNIKAVDLKKKYVYFPLHLQPEMTTDTMGGIYEDQLLAIEKLAAFIPDDWKIYIKENPKQTFYKRNKDFYRRLNSISKAVLVNPAISTYELNKHSQFVATITGTAGFEAITGGKNVLVFGYAWYRQFPRAFEYDSGVTCDEIMNFKCSNEVVEEAYNKFYRSLFKGYVIPESDARQECPEYEGDEKNNEYLYNSFCQAIKLVLAKNINK